MDPITAAGIGLSVTSLTLQVFSGCIKGYQLFMEMEGMPAKYQHLRLRLSLEQTRLLHWGRNVGLLQDQLEEPSQTLRLNRNIILDILLDIQKLFREALTCTDKYDPVLNVDSDRAAPTSVRESMLQWKLSTLEKKATLSLRLQWATVRHGHFKSVIDRLIDYNSVLEGLVDSATLEKIHQMHLQTNLTMLQMTSKIDQLESLSQALLHAPRIRSSELSRSSTKVAEPDQLDQVFSALATFKAQQALVESRHQTLQEWLIPTSEVQMLSSHEARPLATLPGRTVWIEWKDFVADPNTVSQWNQIIQNRLSKLSFLLGRLDNPTQFRAPFCWGYFSPGARDACYGLLYSFPDQRPITRSPVSLNELFKRVKIPSLSKRIALAHGIAECLMFLHSVNWLHKGISSHAILFRANSIPDLAEPILSGFDFARPDFSTELTERMCEAPEIDIYRHPDLLRANHSRLHRPPNRSSNDLHGTQVSRKSYDIYSLGLVLLEIAHWRPLKEIVGIDFDAKGLNERLRGVRKQIIGAHEETGDILAALGSVAGDTYAAVVERCITGGEALGVPGDALETDPAIAVQMQQLFAEEIVNRLSGIRT